MWREQDPEYVQRWDDSLESDMRIYGINPEMATDRKRRSVMVKNVDTT